MYFYVQKNFTKSFSNLQKISLLNSHTLILFLPFSPSSPFIVTFLGNFWLLVFLVKNLIIFRHNIDHVKNVKKKASYIHLHINYKEIRTKKTGKKCFVCFVPSERIGTLHANILEIEPLHTLIRKSTFIIQVICQDFVFYFPHWLKIPITWSTFKTIYGYFSLFAFKAYFFFDLLVVKADQAKFSNGVWEGVQKQCNAFSHVRTFAPAYTLLLFHPLLFAFKHAKCKWISILP